MPRAVPKPAPDESEMPAHLQTFNPDEWPRGWRPALPGEDNDYAVRRRRYGESQWHAHRRLWFERQGTR